MHAREPGNFRGGDARDGAGGLVREGGVREHAPRVDNRPRTRLGGVSANGEARLLRARRVRSRDGHHRGGVSERSRVRASSPRAAEEVDSARSLLDDPRRRRLSETPRAPRDDHDPRRVRGRSRRRHARDHLPDVVPAGHLAHALPHRDEAASLGTHRRDGPVVESTRERTQPLPELAGG